MTLLLAACSQQADNTPSDEKGPRKEELSADASPVWISQQITFRIFERMLEEDPSGQVFIEGNQENPSNNSGSILDKLADGGVVVKDDGNYTFVSDQDKWENGELDAHHSLMSAGIRRAEVHWCEPVINGEDFRDEYLEEFSGKYETQSEYHSSIDDYENCKPG
jgi:hypothetical protein